MKQATLRSLMRKTLLTRMRFFIMLMLAAAVIIAVTNYNLINLYISTYNLSSFDDINARYRSGSAYVDEDDVEIFYIGSMTSGKNKTHYYVVPVSDNNDYTYVLFKSRADLTENTDSYGDLFARVGGRLAKIADIDQSAVNEVISQLTDSGWTKTQAQSYTSTEFLIDGTGSRAWNMIYIGGLLILALLMLYMAIDAGRDAGSPDRSKLARKLETVNGAAFELLADRIDTSLQSGRVLFSNKTVFITDDYILSRRGMRLDVRRTADLMWIKPTVTNHYTNGIPTGKTYSLVCYMCGKKNDIITISIRNKKGMDDIVASLASGLPSVTVGYSDEMKTMYSKDFDGFVQKWRDRARVLAQTAAERPASAADPQPPAETAAPQDETAAQETAETAEQAAEETDE